MYDQIVAARTYDTMALPFYDGCYKSLPIKLIWLKNLNTTSKGHRPQWQTSYMVASSAFFFLSLKRHQSRIDYIQNMKYSYQNLELELSFANKGPFSK
jgi:hypothetical protein